MPDDDDNLDEPQIIDLNKPYKDYDTIRLHNDWMYCPKRDSPQWFG